MADERLRRVPSLSVDAAVELFAHRAQSLSADESIAVAEVCRRLDGIPLAIELAASRMESMTATEVRDRLDRRFKLLVGSRRGLERHQTLRHAVAWSYDLLDDPEKALLEHCSAFSGGFDVQSACAVAGSDDEFDILDLLDALVRKSLLVADRSGARTRFSMLETIRQFAEEKLVERGDTGETSKRHARHFAASESEVLSLWDSPRQREAYDWFHAELPNLRSAVRWAADNGEVDIAVTLTTLAGLLGLWVENYEPGTWAEELIEPTRTAGHHRLGWLYLVATMCSFGGRIEDAVSYMEAAHAAMRESGEDAPFSVTGLLASVYLAIGRVDRWAELCRARLNEAPDTHGFSTSSLIMALSNLQRYDEAIAATEGLVERAESTDNPSALSYALLAYGVAFRDADSPRSLAAVRRGLRVTQDFGIGASESIMAMTLCKLEADTGDPLAALDCATVAIRNFHRSGNVSVIGVPLCNLAYLFDRLGRYDPAATIFGNGYTLMAAVTGPGLDLTMAHLREALGDETYQSLADTGGAMTMAEVVAYAYDQIDRARTELESRR
jgi:tetratricopeptide (TPR) repeat protein